MSNSMDKNGRPAIINLLIKKRKRRQHDEFFCEIPSPTYVCSSIAAKVRSFRTTLVLGTLAFYCLTLAFMVKGRVTAKYNGVITLGNRESQLSRRNNDNDEYTVQRKILEAITPTTNVIINSPSPSENGIKIGKLKLATSSRFISSISPPQLQKKSMSAFGAWMKDPAAVEDTIYVMDHYFRNMHVITYENAEDFAKEKVSEDFELPCQWGGTGHTVYKGHLYFNRYNSSLLSKYSFSKGEIVATKDLPNAAFGNMAPYQWAGSTDIDFSVDRDELWVIFASAQSGWNITIGRLNPETLEVQRTWTTNYRKRSAANAFIINGILYTLHRYDSPNTMLNYAFDTRTSTYFWPKIPFEIKFGSIASLDYNHVEKKLYAWDRGHQVTYDVEFK